MANLQLYKKRLKSIKATGEMASAMKTVASVKYSKLSKIVSETRDYSNACGEILNLVADAAFKREAQSVEDRDCIVVLSSNRGFCGGYNSELIKYLNSENRISESGEDPLYIACGKKIQSYFPEKHTRAVSVDISDIPTYEEAQSLTQLILDIYRNGEADRVFVIYQKFINMMTQKPCCQQILPHRKPEDVPHENDDILYIPDRETFSKSLAFDCLCSEMYGILLSAAAGSQAATVVAMRNACDNASESSQQLELMINRVRQAQVTNSVIETSSGMMTKLEN